MVQIETLEQFKKRIYSFEYHSVYLNQDSCFYTNRSLNIKVDVFGNLKPYIGNTMVFTLNSADTEVKAVRKRLIWLQEVLYDKCRDMLAEPLTEDSFHMTLHDLVNGSSETVSEENMYVIERKAKKFMESAHREAWTVRLKTTCLFNMVNTSVVLGLEPCCDTDCQRLMELYEDLEEIWPLGYPMTPHITLAYYRPGIYQEAEAKKLEDVFKTLSEEYFEIEFTTKVLKYQKFSDMNHFTT